MHSHLCRRNDDFSPSRQGLELDPEGFLVQTLVDVLEELFEFEEGELEGQGKMK